MAQWRLVVYSRISSINSIRVLVFTNLLHASLFVASMLAVSEEIKKVFCASNHLEKGLQLCAVLGISYTLWQTNIACWNIPFFNKKYIFNRGPFSIATLVCRSVSCTISLQISPSIALPSKVPVNALEIIETTT